MALRTSALLIIALMALCASCSHPPPPKTADTKALTEANPTDAQDSMEEKTFSAQEAWDEFKTEFLTKYAYLDDRNVDVEALMEETSKRALQTTNAVEFRASVRGFLYTLTDPHVILGPLTNDDYNVLPTTSDLMVEHRDGIYLILDVRVGSDAAAKGVRPGWRVLEVEGQAIDEAAKAPFAGLLETYTDRQLSVGATLSVNGKRRTPRKVTFEVEGQRREMDLDDPYVLVKALQEQPKLDVRTIEGGYGVLRINNCLGDMELVALFDEAIKGLDKAPGLIIDLRNTPSGGNTAVARGLLGHFVTEAKPYQMHTIPAIERHHGVPRRFVEYVMPRAPHYGGPIVVLGGAWTGSMGEGLVIGFDAAAKAHTIASPMAKLLGAIHNIRLEASDSILDMGVEALFHVDGTPRGDYVADEALVRADMNADGSDPAMASALKWLKTQK